MKNFAILAVILGNCISARSIAQPIIKNDVKVIQFTPTGDVSQADQVHVQFSGPKLTLGQERNASFIPFTSNCETLGKGRWLNTNEWVFDFTKTLPPKTVCSFKSTPALGSPQTFTFQVTASRIINTVPYGESKILSQNGTVEPDQIFILTFDHLVSKADIEKRLFFTVDGEKSGEVPVEVLGTDVLKKIKKESRVWIDLKNDQQTIVAIRAKLDFPNAPGKLITLVDREASQKLYYRTTPSFSVEFSCSRDNPKSPCSPISTLDLRFNAPVAVEDLAKIKLVGISPGAATVSPWMNDDSQSKESHSDVVRFKNPFRADATYRVEMPKSLKDIRGRSLSNIASFPLQVKTGGLPVLAKFPGDFGILESENPILPVSIRNVEKQLNYSFAPLSQFTTAENAVSILNWLDRVAKQHERTYSPTGGDEVDEPEANEDGTRGKKDLNASAKNYRSVFATYDSETKGKIQKATIPSHEGKDSAEVLGIPLQKNGLQIVELESKILGNQLLASHSSLFSSTAVLVTNLGVHFKRAKAGQSLVWVTELSSGKPIANAQITIQTCSGRTLAQGTTKEDGTFSVLNLPSASSLRSTKECGYRVYKHTQLVVMAKKGDDFSFALDSWQEGIESWRFNVGSSFGDENSTEVAHSVMDRDFLQPGQIVHFKHYVRDFNWNGLKLPSKLPQTLVIQHMGSDQKWTFPVQFSAQGIAFTEWKVPESANLGTYQLFLSKEKDPTAKKKRSYGEAIGLSSGSFEVQEFRLPTLNIAVKAPLEITSGKKVDAISLQGTYLSGGPASDLPIEVRFLKEKTSPHARTVKGVVYGQDLPVQTGVFDEKNDEDEDSRTTSKGNTLLNSKIIQKVNLDAAGSAYFDFPKELIDTQQDGEIHYSISYTDPNGEIQSQNRITSLLSRDRYLGVAWDAPWYFDSAKNNPYEIILGDINGKGIVGETVELTLYEKNRYTHRTRLVGGFYGYHSTNEIKKLSIFCAGKTDENGKLKCMPTFPHSGDFIVEARARDSQGKDLLFVQNISIYGVNSEQSEYTESDRMTLNVNQDEFEAGDTAKIVVQSPFKKFNALVTVEREGVLSSFTTELSGDKPVVSVPIKKEYSPNVVVSVFAIRGRIDTPPATGSIDLAKPSFKLGMVALKIGKKSHQIPMAVKTSKLVYQIRETVPVEIETKAGAEVSVAVIDQALLKLHPNESWNLLDRLIVSQSHQVVTSTSQLNVIGKRHFGKKATPFGGGGGKMLTRELLDSLVAWIPNLKADANGKISTKFKLNDSISSFAVVAIGSEGLDLFGTGRTLIAATQDLQIISSVPPVLREKDRLPLSFILRNTTAKGMQVKTTLTARNASLPAQELEIPGQSSREVKWDFTIPDLIDGKGNSLSLQVSAVANEGAKDSLKFSTKVQRLVPAQVISGSLQQLSGEELKTPIQLPKETLPGQAGMRLQLLPRLSTEPESSLQYLRNYEFNCLEQQTSKAIGLHDLKAWKKVLASVKTYLDSNGLLKFFPQSRYGSLDLTAYFLKISALAALDDPSFSIKKEEFTRDLLKNLKRGIHGEIKITQTWWPDYYEKNERIHALDALSYYESVPANDYEMIRSLANSHLLDHALSLSAILSHSPSSLGQYKADLDQYSNEILSHYQFDNTHLRLKENIFLSFSPLAASPDGEKARTLLSFIQSDQKENATKLLRTLIEDMKTGYFDTTPGNALSLTSIRNFRKKYEMEAVSGKLVASLDTQKAVGNTLYLPIQDVASNHTLTQSFQGTGKPWSFALLEAAIPVTNEVNQGYHLEKSVAPIQSTTAGTHSKGDTYQVTLVVDSKTPQSWVVIKDPIPTGASILSTEGSDSNAWIAFEERRMDRMQVFFEYLPQGKTKYIYTVRLNQNGSFSLPSTRVEAMYDPSQYGEIPNAKMDVRP